MPVVKLENKSARILHISLGGGRNVPVPPSEKGPMTVKLSDSEKEAFDINVATETVQEWITAGDLVITDAEPEPEPEPEDEPVDTDEDEG